MKNFVVVKETICKRITCRTKDTYNTTWVNVKDPFVLNCSLIEKITSYSFSDTKEVVFDVKTTDGKEFSISKKIELQRILDAIDIDINDFISKKYKEKGDGYIEPSRKTSK